MGNASRNVTASDILRIDITNLLMIVLSAVMAWLLPMQLFVVSYVFLGPLHYLTEIGWLHGKKYFSNTASKQKVYLPYTLIAPSLLLFLIMVKEYLPAEITSVLDQCKPYTPGIIIGTLIWSISMIIRLTDTQRIFLLAGLVIGSYLMSFWYLPSLFIGLMIPTLIHVFVFTGLFMVQGAIQYGNLFTYGSLALFIIAALSFFVLPFSPLSNVDTKFWHEAWQYSGLNRVVSYTTGTDGLTTYNNNTLLSRWQGFVAFAYTYHYLNWFTKAEIIKWHMVPKKTLWIIGLTYVGAIGIYLYDLKIGFQALYSLSMLHVVLEFPLNLRSIQGIFTVLKTRLI